MKRLYPFVTVDVFTRTRFGGNPLAVFPDARGLSDAEMQALSETTFVLPPDDPAHTAKVRIFTVAEELPFAGHPNVGTGFVLAQAGRAPGGVMLFEEKAGLVEVRIEHDENGSDDRATIAAPQPLSLGAAMPPDLIAACAGVRPAEIVLAAHPPLQASVGNGFVLAEVEAEALSRAAPDLGAFRRAVSELPALNGRLDLYLHARARGPGEPIRARMFAPLAGIWEDPATGSAATPLAALLLSLTGEPSARYDILQGVEMGRPSLLRTSAHRAADGIRASVGGSCVPVLRGEAQLST
jgi:trans-2,3-dihydro-3-hydroxyanthranilate isomerase